MKSVFFNSYEIKMIIYDFDGVMTDNKVLVNEEGVEMVAVHRGDGLAIGMLREKGMTQMIVSTEHNKVVSQRANKLKIPVVQGVNDKAEAVIKICDEKNISLKHIMYIGNDLNDKEVMSIVGVRGCPADAEKEIVEISEWVSKRCGGDGVIRDLLDSLLF